MEDGASVTSLLRWHRPTNSPFPCTINPSPSTKPPILRRHFFPAKIMSSRFLCIVVLLHLLIAASASASATPIGVTYNPSARNLPSPDRVVAALLSLQIPAVQLLDPTPAAVRAFSYTNISLLLAVPNRLIPAFAANASSADLWIRSLVLPFYPRTRISLISAGSDAINTILVANQSLDSSTVLLLAIHNLHRGLLDLGIRTIPVSTTLSFTSIMTTSFPPSAAEFQEPIGSLIVRPLLEFLQETNSTFLINVYPYNIYRICSEIPIGFTLFQELPFNFRDDVITGVRYWNLFDMMVDSVVAAMAVSGRENIPVLVAETGWPSDSEYQANWASNSEYQAGESYSEMYLNGLVAHLRPGTGTPLRKEGAAEVYIYQLFDDDGEMGSTNDTIGTTSSAVSRTEPGLHWGIMHPNLTMKYNIHFSGSSRALVDGETLVETCFVVSVLCLL